MLVHFKNRLHFNDFRRKYFNFKGDQLPMNRYECDIGLGGSVVRLVAAGAKCPSKSAIQVPTRPGIEICFSGLNMRRNPFIGIESVLGLVDRG